MWRAFPSCGAFGGERGNVCRGKQTGGHCQGECGSRIIITQALSRLRTTCGSLEWCSCSQPVITRAKALWVLSGACIGLGR
jgi:hypothetical protein